jgi:multiple sugar transport system permease protein/raffinose/stachyose/melibiose transport system permease protein
MLGVAVVMLYPFWFMITTSLHTQAQYLAGHGSSIRSWSELNSVLPIWQELLNSTIICACSITLILIVSMSAGYAFAKLRYRGSETIFLCLVAAMMIPLQSILMPEYVNVSRFGLTSSYLGAVLVYAALGTPFATFLMTTYFRSLPDELVEAGICDGLSYFGTLRRIALPLALPAIATVTVLQFVQIWDDLLVGLLFISDNAERPITVGLAVLASGRVTSIPVLMAGSLVSAIPAMAVYLGFQRYLVRGLTLGISK